MTATTHSTALATIQPAFTDTERLALAGFLAGYRGLTHEAYTLDLRQFTGWCRARSLSLLSVRRADIETFARDLEARDRARATVTRRGRDRTVLRQLPACCIHSGCIRHKHDAAKAAKAQRRGQMTLPAGRHVDPFSMVGKPLPTSLDAGVPLRDVQEAASHADPRTAMRYDRARTSLDRHATYIVAAFIAGAAR